MKSFVQTRYTYPCITIAVIITVLLVSSKWRSNSNDQLPNATKDNGESGASPRHVQSLSSQSTNIGNIVGSEELILKLNPLVNDLAAAVLNLRLPDHQSRDVFAEKVDIVDLEQVDPDRDRLTSRSALVSSGDWPVWQKAKTIPKELVQIWQPLMSSIAFFEHAKFSVVNGEFQNNDLFRTVVAFHGLAYSADSNWSGIDAELTVDWNRATSSANSESNWQITGWYLRKFSMTRQATLSFSEALDDALPAKSDLHNARTSLHENRMIDFFSSGGAKRPEKYFSPASLSQNPGVSAADVDGDGWDDLYVSVTTGKNQLLMNQRDGTFVESAEEWGLDIDGYSSCGLFADFDNDGDPDLLLGRTLKRSMYFENLGRRFVHRAAAVVGTELPALVTSISAADYDQDGLLDVFISTYQPTVISGPQTRSDRGTNDLTEIDQLGWPEEFLSPDDAAEFRRRQNATNDPLVLAGPPNVLLRNRGGGSFELGRGNDQLAVWKNTLQGTWSDFDADGDPDLHVCNDWGPDYLFRNDQSNGFTDITDQAGVNQAGFGMGAAWGDYDNDGDQDLYVSNMYSKAGRRIAAQIDQLDPRIAALAAGNHLLQNSGSSFNQVAGVEPPAQCVAKAGWSWGGQFADFNNDGFLDIYVSSGYFTVPSDYAIPVDL